MLNYLTVAVLPLVVTQAEWESLEMRMTPHAPRVHIVDPLYLKLVVRNQGDKAIVLPGGFSREIGTMRIELYAADGFAYRFNPEGAGVGGVTDVSLRPGEEIVMYEQLFIAPVGELDRDFWKIGGGELTASVRLRPSLELRSGAFSLGIAPRPEAECALIKDIYGKGPAEFRQSHGHDADLPTLNTYGLLRFPLRASKPETLEALDAQLSPGSLKNIVRATRYTQAIYFDKPADKQALAIANLKKFVQRLPDIERECIAMQVVLYFLTVYRHPDAAEPFVELMPDRIGSLSGRRAEALKEIEAFRPFRRTKR